MALFAPIDDKKKKPTLPERPPTVIESEKQPISEAMPQRPIEPLPQSAPATQSKSAPMFPPIETLGETPTAPTPADEPMPVRPGILPPLPEASQSAPTAPSSMMQPSLLEQRQREYDAALAAPVQKQGKGKQALFMALQALGNIATGQNKPIEWLGNAKKQYAVDQAARELAPVQQQEQWKQQQEARKAQIDEIKRRPEKEALARQQKFDLEAQRQIGRIQLQQQKDAAEGKQWKQVTRNGKFFKLYGDGKEEPIIDPTTGQQEEDLLEKPVKTTSENGTELYAKGGQILSYEGQKAYREAMLGEKQKDREFRADQNERDRAFQAKENEARRQFEILKKSLDTETAAIQAAADDASRKAAVERKAEIQRQMMELRTQHEKDIADYKKALQ